MKAFRANALWMSLLLSACEIERTPADYIDRASSEEAGRAEAAAEVRDRVLAMGQALGRRNSADALVALAPARDVFVIGPWAAGEDGLGAEQIAVILDSLAARPVPALTRDVVVSVAPRANVAWFQAAIAGDSVETPGMRMTGTYELNEGAWQLVQAHLSAPLIPPPPQSPPEEAEDSAEAG